MPVSYPVPVVYLLMFKKGHLIYVMLILLALVYIIRLIAVDFSVLKKTVLY